MSDAAADGAGVISGDGGVNLGNVEVDHLEIDKLSVENISRGEGQIES